MDKSFDVRNERQAEIAINYIKHLDLTENKEWLIDIHLGRESLSSLQRGLYFRWLDFISKHTGDSKDDLHFEYKKKFLIRIFYTATRKPHQKFKDAVDKCNDARAAGHDELADTVMQVVIDNLSIKKANTKEMAEYMDEIYYDCTNPDTGLGIYLPLPPSSGIK